MPKTFKRGFTLVEIIVALGIFSIVATVALGALVRIISANTKAQSIQSAVTNLNFAIESISREMRVGYSYHCTKASDSAENYNGTTLLPKACDIGEGLTVAFKSSKTKLNGDGSIACHLAYAYRFKSASPIAGFKLQKAQQSDCVVAIDGSVDSADFSDVTAPDVTINTFRLGVAYDASNHLYSRTFVRIAGTAGARVKEQTDFDVQTSISARLAQ